MILVFSAQTDECAARVYDRLREGGHEVALIDDSLDTGSLGINWYTEDPPNRSSLEIRGRRVAFPDIQGILLRYLNPLRPNPEQPLHDQRYVLYELSAALQGFLDAVECPVINRPVPGSAGKRLYTRPDGLPRVLEAGFKAPRTFVGGSKNTARTFANRLAGRGAVITGINIPIGPTFVEPGGLVASLEEIYSRDKIVPLYVQELVPGDLVQAYIVGNRAFAVDGGSWPMNPQGNDAPLRAGDLDESVRRRCVALAGELGLAFAQINLVHTPDDQWLCYDVNEFPIFGHCEENVQADISQAIADYLSTPRRAVA